MASKKVIQKFTEDTIRKAVIAHKVKTDKALFLILQRVGEQFIINARSTNTYKDRTRNLRGSIGYAIIKDGKILHQGFADRDNEGRSKAVKMIDRLMNKYSDHRGFALLGVAAMGYAAYVESQGLDVITGSSQIAEKSLIQAFFKFQFKIKRL
jgi:hypothetical protein